MFAKLLVTAVVALASMVIFRQIAERNKRANAPVKSNKNRQIKTKNLVWDEKSQSYRAED